MCLLFSSQQQEQDPTNLYMSNLPQSYDEKVQWSQVSGWVMGCYAIKGMGYL